MDYNGDPWPENVKQSFVSYVENGGRVVVYHAANNAFPEWPEGKGIGEHEPILFDMVKVEFLRPL